MVFVISSVEFKSTFIPTVSLDPHKLIFRGRWWSYHYYYFPSKCAAFDVQWDLLETVESKEPSRKI